MAGYVARVGDIINTNFHGVESLLESQFLLSKSSNCQYFMEPKYLHCVLKSLKLAPILRQMYPVGTFPFHFLKSHFNIILPSTFKSPKSFIS
jgi:hypothetical protein